MGVSKVMDEKRQPTVEFEPDIMSTPVTVLPNQTDNILVPPSNSSAGDLSSEEYSFTELKSGPVLCRQSSTFVSSTSISSSSFPSAADCTLTNALSKSNLTTVSLASNTNTGHDDASWLEGKNQSLDKCFTGHDEEEEGELFFQRDTENDVDFERRHEIQQCLGLNRDYQVVMYFPCPVENGWVLSNICQTSALNIQLFMFFIFISWQC